MSAQSPPAGFVRRDPNASLGKRIAVVLTLVPAGVLILSLIAGPGWGLAVGVLVIGLVLVVGKDAIRAALDWHPPQLEVAASPYGLGSTPVVTYRRKPKRPTDVADFAVACRLTCREEVTYTHGTDTSTETRDVVEHACNGTGEGTSEGLVAEVELPITASAGAPSMNLPSNKITWFLDVEVRGPRLPQDSHTFTIDVGPTLDLSLRHGVQDS